MFITQWLAMQTDAQDMWMILNNITPQRSFPPLCVISNTMAKILLRSYTNGTTFRHVVDNDKLGGDLSWNTCLDMGPLLTYRVQFENSIRKENSIATSQIQVMAHHTNACKIMTSVKMMMMIHIFTHGLTPCLSEYFTHATQWQHSQGNWEHIKLLE